MALMKHILWSVRGVGTLAWYYFDFFCSVLFCSFLLLLFIFVPASRQEQGQGEEKFMGISGLIAYCTRQPICNRREHRSDSSGAQTPPRLKSSIKDLSSSQPRVV